MSTTTPRTGYTKPAVLDSTANFDALISHVYESVDNAYGINEMGAAPTPEFTGQFYANTTNDNVYIWDGVEWQIWGNPFKYTEGYRSYTTQSSRTAVGGAEMLLMPDTTVGLTAVNGRKYLIEYNFLAEYVNEVSGNITVRLRRKNGSGVGIGDTLIDSTDFFVYSVGVKSTGVNGFWVYDHTDPTAVVSFGLTFQAASSDDLVCGGQGLDSSGSLPYTAGFLLHDIGAV